MPYITNTFAFFSARNLDMFIRNRLAAQRREMRDVVVWSVRRFELGNLACLSKLSNLTKLTIHGLLRRSDSEADAVDTIPDAFCDEMLKALKKLSVEEVHIRIRVTHRVERSGVDLVKLEARTKEMEKKLLRSNGNELFEKDLDETPYRAF